MPQQPSLEHDNETSTWSVLATVSATACIEEILYRDPNSHVQNQQDRHNHNDIDENKYRHQRNVTGKQRN